MIGEGEAGAENEEGAEVQEDTEVGAETGEVEAGLKRRDILLHPRETHLDLEASPHQKNGTSRKSWMLERFTKGTIQENREGRNGRRTMLTEEGRVKEMEKKISADLKDRIQGKTLRLLRSQRKGEVTVWNGETTRGLRVS